MRKGRKWLPAVLSVAMVLQPFAGIGSVTAMAADGVNTVAGATCSSKAIKDACQKAFNAAKK